MYRAYMYSVLSTRVLRTLNSVLPGCTCSTVPEGTAPQQHAGAVWVGYA
eukprot:COSAG02_NODE_1465_length_12485_cov_9.526804_8_plen_49_part_00